MNVAPDEATIREHAQRGGFPADNIARITSVIDPTTAESSPGDVDVTMRRAP